MSVFKLTSVPVDAVGTGEPEVIPWGLVATELFSSRSSLKVCSQTLDTLLFNWSSGHVEY